MNNARLSSLKDKIAASVKPAEVKVEAKKQVKVEIKK